ncbi:hypothetical protein BKA56DRAFT_676463 [Ilyonectria sp. MPI-CAGE-AT-0026]|nr:hypothetical protein BKA56DRAFT_676463 [Ilyonectria sp. MPI-CAGE-AT-0026]
MNHFTDANIIHRDGIGHHPFGAASNYFRDDLVTWLCNRVAETQISISLEEEVARLHDENNLAQVELHERQTNHDLLVGDMMRPCDEIRG